ncbi:MAG: PD-(D/E)XK nuclease family protein [Deltaproteobacteria bacterium]|nr:PD-(D/E)XK nuclease family protein [Deltaproteobacteria bacterium]
MHKANVSQIHLLQRCPRLLAYQLRGRRNAWKIGLAGTGVLPGTLFHDQIAAPFHKMMASGSSPAVRQRLKALLIGPGENLEMGLLALLEEHFFLPVIKRQSKKLSADQVMQLGRALELWNRHLAQFIRKALLEQRGDIDTLPAKTFHNPEELIKSVYDLGDGETFRVIGKYDALLFDAASGEAVVMEFKGRKAGYAEEDFLQIVLYCWLIKTKTGITPRGVIFYLEEEEPEVRYSSEDITCAMQNLPDLFRRVIDVMEAVSKKQKKSLPPAPDLQLCAVCPFDPQCDGEWGPRIQEISTTPDHETKEAFKEAEKGMASLVNALQALRLPVEPSGYTAGPRFIRLKIKPLLDQGVTVRKLMNQAENLQVALRLHVAPLIQPQAGYVSVDVPRKVRIPLTLGEVWRKGQRNRPHSKVAFPIGMSIDGSIVWADLSDPTMTSMLVGGTAGSGKSVFLRSAAIGLALNAKPEDVRITLIDSKRITFTDLTSLPHLSGPVLMDNDPAMEKLSQLVDEMEKRYRLFEKMRAPDISAYNQRAETLSRQVVMIDEYADLISGKTTREKLELSIQRLGQKGRAAGIHLILATQRPDARVVTPIIKANLQLKVALKVTTASNSSIILDQTGAEYLIGHGDMIIGGSVPIQRLQGPLVTKTEIELAMQKDTANGST